MVEVVHSRKEEETSTYFEVSKETVHKHFGETPVKRKKSAHKVVSTLQFILFDLIIILHPCLT